MLVKYYRPRRTILFAGVLTALGAMLRLVGASLKNSLGGGAAYLMIFFGQARHKQPSP